MNPPLKPCTGGFLQQKALSNTLLGFDVCASIPTAQPPPEPSPRRFEARGPFGDHANEPTPLPPRRRSQQRRPHVRAGSTSPRYYSGKVDSAGDLILSPRLQRPFEAAAPEMNPYHRAPMRAGPRANLAIGDTKPVALPTRSPTCAIFLAFRGRTARGARHESESHAARR